MKIAKLKIENQPAVTCGNLHFSIFNFQSLLQNPFNLMVFVKGKRHGDESIVC